jgi:hypothetical protein
MENLAMKYIQERKWNEAFDVSYKHKWLIMSWVFIMVWIHCSLCFKLNMIITIGLANDLHWLELTVLPNNRLCLNMDNNGMINFSQKYIYLPCTSFVFLHLFGLIFTYCCQR